VAISNNLVAVSNNLLVISNNLVAIKKNPGGYKLQPCNSLVDAHIKHTVICWGILADLRK